MTLELNPYLTESGRAVMEQEAFLYNIADYWGYLDMIAYACAEYPYQTSKIREKASPFPNFDLIKGGNRDMLYWQERASADPQGQM
ncbi:hypothetical protein SBRCBS47491_005822 [Sporothrix bragantina]|uniref:Uncharacterized protein n=1 Tax=Sporothrix bragantina TaxID=671064 RepID=A0ABP0C1Y1_9PEZI